MTGGPTAPTPFVGRTEELAALRDAFDAAADGLVVALVAGDHGVGKTALARAFARERRAHGVPVHWASCAPLGGAPPFWPWVQVVRSLGDQVLDDARADLAARVDEPFAAFDILHGLLRDRAAEPRIIVLDDLHAADIGSIELLRHLATVAADLPLLVVGVHRLHELRTDVARDVALAAIASGARRILPGLLGPDDVRTLLGAAEADAEAVVDDIVARSGGNALYVEQLVDAVRREGAAGLARIPAGIRAAVRAGLDPLPSSTRALLVQATVLTAAFGIDVLAEVADVTVTDVRRTLAPAFASGVLAEGDDGVSFTHVVVRDVLAEELLPEERAVAHAAAARACAARVERGDPMAPAVVAQHLLDAGEEVPAQDVARWAERAAEAARAATDLREAARWSEAASHCWARAGDARAQARCLVAASSDRSTVGDGAEAVALSSALADLARELDSAELLARAARARAGVFEAAQDVDGPLLLREALDHPDAREDPGRCADLLAALAKLAGMPSIDGSRRDGAAARSALAELEELAASGDARCRGRLADAQLNVWSGPRHHEDRRRWLAEYAALLPPGRDVRERLDQVYWATSLAFEAGELHEVDRLLREWERLADRCDSAFWRWRGQMAQASLLYAQGRLGAAEALATSGGGLVATLHPDMALRVVMGLVLAIRMDQGRFGEVVGSAPVDLGVLSVMAAVERGDEAEARRLLAGVVAAAEATGPDDLYWLCLQSLIALAAEAVGDVERCGRVADDLEPFVDQMVMWGRSNVFGPPVSELVGIANRGAGRLDAAADAFRRAMAWSDRAGAVGFGARARLGLASVLAPDDARRAPLLAEARATAARLGMGSVVARADALDATSVSAGSPPGADAPHPHPNEVVSGPRAIGARSVAAGAGAIADGAATVDLRPAPVPQPRIRTLGRFEVVGAGATEPTRWTSRKARDALKVLICRRGRALPREELIDLLWPDADLAVGRSRLSVVLSMLRAALDPERLLPSDPLRADRQSIALDLDVVSVDVEELLAQARAGLREGAVGAPDPTALVMAVALGDEGEFLAEDPYVDWARPLRATVERTRRDVLRALAGVAEAAGDGAAAVRWWSRLVELDPEDRSARRALRDVLVAEGRHGEVAALERDPGTSEDADL